MHGRRREPLNPRISDLSATGAFIDSMIEVPAGSRMRMKFTLPDGTAVAVGAEVVHSMPHFGMGVRFLDLTDEQRGAIERFVSGASQVGAAEAWAAPLPWFEPWLTRVARGDDSMASP